MQKLLKQIESGFKRQVTWNKYQSKMTEQKRSRYLDLLINPGFQGVNRFIVLSYENRHVWESYKKYFPLTVEITDYKVMIDGRNFFNQTVKMIWEHMITFKKMQMVEVMIRPLVVY